MNLDTAPGFAAEINSARQGDPISEPGTRAGTAQPLQPYPLPQYDARRDHEH